MSKNISRMLFKTSNWLRSPKIVLTFSIQNVPKFIKHTRCPQKWQKCQLKVESTHQFDCKIQKSYTGWPKNLYRTQGVSKWYVSCFEIYFISAYYNIESSNLIISKINEKKKSYTGCPENSDNTTRTSKHQINYEVQKSYTGCPKFISYTGCPKIFQKRIIYQNIEWNNYEK